jgi:microsomal epoxide hydrolase
MFVRWLAVVRVLLLVAFASVSAAPLSRAQTAGPVGDVRIESRFFTTSDGVRLHYLTAGRGPALIFVPGWTMPAEIWSEQLRDLARDFHVVALDPRSQGDSAQAADGHYPERRARDVAELVTHLGAADVTLVGWSLAVPELLTYTEQHGTSALRALVLVDGFIGADPDPAAPNPLRPTLIAMQKDRRAYTDSFVRSMFRTKRPDTYLAHLTERSMRTPTNTAFTLLANLMLTDGDWRPAVRKLDRPLLYVVQPSLQQQAEMVKALKPSARVEVFADAGHALFVDAPDRFATILREFAASAAR